MNASLARIAARVHGLARLSAVALLLASTFAMPAGADVTLRVEARPPGTPIEVYVAVNDVNGNPVGGFDSTDFDPVTIDGNPITIAAGDLTLPPSQNPGEQVSIVFTMDYSPSVVAAARVEMEDAVVNFINAMQIGDYAAIVKFNVTLGATIVAPFTEIDGGNNNAALALAARSDYDGNGTNLLDALDVSLNHILDTASLPPGPKAIALVSDGGEFDSTNATLSEVLELANDNGIAIFTIGVADFTAPGYEELLETLAGDTGGGYFPTPDPADIQGAYDAILVLLQNEYKLTIAGSIADAITDCLQHELVVTVTGQAPESVFFTRRTCDTVPDDDFAFGAVTGVAPSEIVTSDPQTITGIEPEVSVSAQISVIQGNYSISNDGSCGANDTDYTNLPGTISNGQTVCVRQQAASQASTTKVTTLTIGGVAGTFSTTTAAANGGGGGGGGGGAAGLFELLLGLCLLLLGRQRAA